jgi:rod shape-determining protein MreC
VVSIFVSIALLALSRLEHPAVAQLRWHVAEFETPVLALGGGIIERLRHTWRTISSMMDLSQEVERLKDENQRLKNWEWRAKESERKLAELASLSAVVKEQPVGFVTSRVIANSGGPFARSALINAGRQQNIRTGYPVLSSAGLVGRIVEAGERAAEVLLLTDLNSRIPVSVGANGVRAVLVGDNSAFPRLAYLAPEAVISPGDEVSTSGVGGLFPRGLRIGVVVVERGSLVVRPHSALDSLEYVSVLYVETASTGLTDGTVAPLGKEARRESLPELPAAVHRGD